jgi:Cd2+/Zn2+-exporting ATPase
MSKKTRLDLPVVLPAIQPQDDCVQLLTDRLKYVRGIDDAHVVVNNGQAQLCIHYDPNLLPLTQVQRIAQDAGAAVGQRYRHEQIAYSRSMAADAAIGLTEVLSRLPGMLHANANYAAGLVSVAYDTEKLTRETIDNAIRGMGYTVVVSSNQVRTLVPNAAPAATNTATLAPAPAVAPHEDHDAKAEHAHDDGHAHSHDDGHDHGSAPAFLPHWMQERWTLLLVAAAGVFFLIGWAGETFFGLPSNIALVFFVLAYIAGSYDIATEAIPGLFKGKLNTDLLMLLAAGGAAILGEWAEGAFLLFLFALGHAGEHYALDRARNAVSELGALMPKTAQVRRGDQIVETNVDDLQVDDVVVVRPGDRMPVDGAVISGESAIDQAPITGESVPVQKAPGDEVFAGTINQDAALDVKVTKLSRDNTLNRVMKMVAEAQSQQSPTQQFTDRFTTRFVPAVLITVALVILVPPILSLMPLQDSFYRGMLLLVAASPCALALGTPAAVLAGIAQAARNGVLIKGGVHLENLGSLNAIAFDKTGTLTEGKFNVTDVVTLSGFSRDDVLRIAGAVEQQSNHPLAQAIVRAAKADKLDLPVAGALENVPGKGVRSSVEGKPVLIGAMKLFDGGVPAEVSTVVRQLGDASKSSMVVQHDGQFIGVIGLADTLKPNAGDTMRRLRELGIKHLVMLTGDKQAVAERIAKDVGLTEVKAELLPEDKLTAIKALQQEHGDIAMIGDGVNDAPALAAATVGIAMGGAGTAVALETADVALMADDVGKLPFAVGLSRASRAIIRQNLAISLGVIAMLILTTFLGLIALPGAVIFHEGSTIVVVLNALRLLAYRKA